MLAALIAQTDIFIMASWYVQKSGINFILRRNEETVGEIQAISASRTLGSVNIKLVEDDELITSSLSSYRPEKNDQFSTCLSSRTRFVEKWNEISKDSMQEVDDIANSYSVENMEQATQQPEDKLAYVYVLVHIKNMKEPINERKFRNVDQNHVNDLKAKIIQNPDLKCRLMLGNTTESKQCLTEELLKTPEKVDVEVIGGNHTRTAIMQILDDSRYKHDTRYQLWPMKVYCQLDRVQAQKLGFDHNIENESVRQTSAFDILQFMRKELFALTNGLDVYTAPQIKAWKANIIHILNLSKDDLHNKYKTLVILAKSPNVVWEKLLQLEELWKTQQIIGQSPGDIKTGHLKQISLLKEIDQVGLLDDLIQRKLTWKDFKNCCSERRKDKRNPLTELSEDQTSDFESHSNDMDLNEEGQTAAAPSEQPEPIASQHEWKKSKDLKVKLTKALATIRLLTEETENLKSKLAVSENKNRKTEENLARNKSKIVELCHEVELLKCQKRELEDDVAYYLSMDKLDKSLHLSSSKRKETDDEDDPRIVQCANKKVMLEPAKEPEQREVETDEVQEKVLFVEYTRRRGFLALQSDSTKSVRYCKTTICQSIRCPKLNFSANSFALEEKAYCLDENYIITAIPNNIMTVRGNELVISKDEEVLRAFLIKSISTYLDTQTSIC